MHLAGDLRLIGVVDDAEIQPPERLHFERKVRRPLPRAQHELAEGEPAVLFGVQKEIAQGAESARLPPAAGRRFAAADDVLQAPLPRRGGKEGAEGAVGIAHPQIFIHDDDRRRDVVQNFLI